MAKRLPSFLKPFFWSYNWEALELEKDKEVIIRQTIKYGDLQHWRWLINQYGLEEVRGVIKRVPETDLRPSLQKLLKLILGIDHFLYARRGVR